jgi:hypothetical protein
MIIIKGISALILYFVLYFMLGSSIVWGFKKRDTSIIFKILIGFFSYYAIFQLVSLPFILLLKPLSYLMISWIVMMFIIVLAFGIQFYRQRERLSLERLKAKVGNIKINIVDIAVIGIVAILFCTIGFYIVTQVYQSFDNAFYIGTVNTALYTNTMHQYDPSEGILLESLNLRYALSSFGMHSAVMSKIFSLHPLVEMKVVVGSECFILSGFIVYQIGQTFFKEDKRFKSILMTGFFLLLNLFIFTEYMPSRFLIFRSFEGKAFCSNVILPFTFLICLLIVRNSKERFYWFLLLVIAISSNGISMTSMLLVPMLICLMLVPFFLYKKQWKHVWKLGICLIPSAAILLGYLLNNYGLLKIYIH